MNWYKLNVDATFNFERNVAGSGLVVRNHAGEVMAATIKFHVYVRDSDMAEGWVVVDGLELAIEMGFYPVVVETDSKRAYEILQGKGMNCLT